MKCTPEMNTDDADPNDPLVPLLHRMHAALLQAGDALAEMKLDEVPHANAVQVVKLYAQLIATLACDTLPAAGLPFFLRTVGETLVALEEMHAKMKPGEKITIVADLHGITRIPDKGDQQ